MSANPVPPHRHARVLACVLCQHRKIKCDRNFPCANCIKANVTCTPSTPAPARKRRRPNQDLQERLSRCEELLKQYANGAAPPPPQGQSPPTPTVGHVKSEPSDSTPISSDSQDSWKPACIMVNDEGGARFMDSYIWASVYEELQAMRDIVETDDPEDSSILGSEDLTPDNNTDLFFPGNLATVNLDDLQPDPIHGFKLWQLFLDRVNPLTKVIHAPTVQPYVMEAATSIRNVPLHCQALLFSIYNMAVISLSEAECVQTFGFSRDQAIQRFTAGTKAALSRFNFLKNYNMSVLQALVLYLYSLQGRYDRHAAWILSGTIVRIAQKMGYHRDGEQLHLEPFETEMRRRVWWQIVIQDSKYAMLSGLRHTMLPHRWDTEMPQNVNDADIIPGSTEPVQPRQGPTEMAFCLMFNEIYKFKMAADNANDAPAFEAAMLGQDLDGATQALEHKLIELENQYVDVNAGNVHKAALTIRPMITNKLSEMLVPDSLFKVVIMGNEQRMDAFEKLQQTGFLWFVKLHFQLDMFAVMTGQLCQRPTGSLADRAWAVTERVYSHHAELYDMSQKQYSIQAQFTVKAWKTRERAFMQAGQALETPHFILRLRELVPTSHDGRSSQRPSQLNLQQQQQQQQNGEMDPFLGGYLDMASLNWDVFGDMVGNGGEQLSAAMFGGLGLGNVPSVGAERAVNRGIPDSF
ncbi:fungal specific transcription factor [Hirsutella rhossiliensis]|uniref:Fungal specific transcription factor domain-containing protein n=1 Tax=Hirsutella rhossiliensis TaxID=111463 RepID=A0A9P8N6R8_9HYPO|nr:fungal specific transcription factor domain-containing protein [Hirsutella rhossiliensis]KAH0967855.1 fungal specific transcription factor domain-containing protein [Hirsutella rhossiliensis]